MKPVTTEKRDLFKNPLSGAELKPYDAVVLDPPRAGAEAQVKALAASAIPRIAYVSCNPATLGRDAVQLRQAGFAIASALPVDQFLWSARLESVVVFAR